MTAPAIIHSSDGVTWTATTSPFDNYGAVREIAWNGSIFVAVGSIYVYSAGAYTQLSAVATSPDGITWTQRTDAGPGTVSYLNGVAYGGGKFVANGGTGLNVFLEYSSDGISWTLCTQSLDVDGIQPAYGGGAITYDGSKFVMLYEVLPGSQTVATTIESTDGITFSGGTSVVNDVGLRAGDIGYGGGDYVVGSYVTPTVGYYSTSADDVTWTTHADSGMAAAYGAMFATYQNGAWWVGSGQQVAKSTDATTWSTQTIATFATGSAMALLYQGGKYLLGGSSGYTFGFYPGVLLSSTDGSTWSSVTIPANSPGIRSIVYNGSVYVAAGEPNLDYAPPGVPTNLACGPD